MAIYVFNNEYINWNNNSEILVAGKERKEILIIQFWIFYFANISFCFMYI